MIKNVIIAILLVTMCVVFGFAQDGTYTTNLLFYMPLYGASGLVEFNEYNAYMEIADNQIEANKTAAGDENICDVSGAMWTGNTETFITITYQDADNTVDAVVPVKDEDNMASDSAVFLCTQQSIKAYADTLHALQYLKTEMDEFAELQAIVADKTLVNEEDICTIDANWVNTANPWADNEVANDITINLATLATTFTCTDNESENLACTLVFVDGATGAQGAETDGDCTYNPSTGMIKSSNVHFSKFDATVAPTVNNDTTEGYVVGSVWYDVTADAAYGCLDNTDGAAVWSQFIPTGGGGGWVDISGAPVQYDFARFTDADTIEGRSYSETKGDLDIGSNIVLCSNYAHPDDAITAIGASDRTLLVTENETCDTNFTVPANVTVAFEGDALWAIANGITVTFNGQINAEPRQIFSYTGTGVLAGTPKIDKAYPQWWGALGDDSNDDTAAIQHAINFTDNIFFPNTPNFKYHCTANITLNDNTYLYFEPGAELEVVMGSLGDFITATSKSNIKIENLRITDEASVDEYLVFNGCDNVLIDNMYTTGTPDWAIDVVNSSSFVTIQNSYFSGGTGGVSIQGSEFVTVVNSETYNHIRSGLRITEGCSNIYFMYNEIKNSMQSFAAATDGAINCYGGTTANEHIYVIGNLIEGTGTVDDGYNVDLIGVQDTNDFYLINNVMTDSAETQRGIYIHDRDNSGCKNYLIEGNVFNIGGSNYTEGFIRQVNDNAENLIIRNNFFLGTTDNTTRLIYLRVNTENTIIEGNIVDTSSLYAFVYSQAAITINGLTINDNQVRTTTAGRAIYLRSGTDVIISNNVFNVGTNTADVITSDAAVSNISVIGNVINATDADISATVDLNAHNIINGAADSTSPTAWDDITNPDANDEIDFAAYTIELNVADFRIGDGGANYVKFADAGVLTLEGTANIEGITDTEFGYLNGISSFGGTIIDDADASAVRTTLGLVIGTNVEVDLSNEAGLYAVLSDVALFLEDTIDDTSPELGGELDAGAHSIGFTQQTVTYNVTTTTVNWTTGNKATVTLTGNVGTFAFTNPSNPCNVLLKIVQDATGSRVVTAWDADIKWAGGTKPTLTTTANGIDICSFYWDGTNYFGVASLAFATP